MQGGRVFVKYSKEKKLLWAQAYREGKLAFDMTPN